MNDSIDRIGGAFVVEIPAPVIPKVQAVSTNYGRRNQYTFGSTDFQYVSIEQLEQQLLNTAAALDWAISEKSKADAEARAAELDAERALAKHVIDSLLPVVDSGTASVLIQLRDEQKREIARTLENLPGVTFRHVRPTKDAATDATSPTEELIVD